MVEPAAGPLGAPATWMTRALLPDDELMNEYEEFFKEDPGIEQEARDAAAEMRNTPVDDLDRDPLQVNKRRLGVSGKVARRAPPNPFHSPKLNKWRTAGGPKSAKVADPALQNNPLRGRLIVFIGLNSALLLVYLQSLVYNFTATGSFYVSHKVNSNLGPAPTTLYDMGGLNTNAIRRGEWIRLYWSMWMHSGWLHIALNILCQMQYLYMLEPDWGTIRTLFVFWVSALMGNLWSCTLDPCKTTVGSSGGLFGLMGGVVPYCIEFWHSIPRPLCILVFSIIVLLVTLATGLSKATDTWAHVGGLFGGVLFGFGTITTPAAFNKQGKPLKKQVKKNAVMRWLQQTVNPECKCGMKEWGIRLASWALLITGLTICYVYLYSRYEYNPPGSLTYKGVTQCCCCYDLLTAVSYERSNWMCMECSTVGAAAGRQTWGEYCSVQKSSRRLLAQLDDHDVSAVLLGDANFTTSLDNAIRSLGPLEWTLDI